MTFLHKCGMRFISCVFDCATVCRPILICVFLYVDMYKYMCTQKYTTHLNKGTKSESSFSPIDCFHTPPLRTPLTGLPISKTMILSTLQINQSTLSTQTHQVFPDRVTLGLWQQYIEQGACVGAQWLNAPTPTYR